MSDKDLESLVRRIPMEKNFSPAVLDRAPGYRGRLHGVRLEELGEREWVVEAGTLGRGDAVYLQHIHLKAAPPEDWMHVFCTCPHGEPCKHLAAVLNFLKEELADGNGAESGPAGAAEQWLDALCHAGEEVDDAGTEDERLRYVLNPEIGPDGRPTVVLRIRLTRRRRAGEGWTRGRAVPLIDASDAHLSFGLRESDRQLARTLMACSLDDGFGRDALLEGPMLGPLLQQLVDTGLCHWRDAGAPPLEQGPRRTLRLFWRREDKHYRLCREPEHLQLILSEQAAYVDEEAGQLGPLALPLPVDRLAVFLRAPRVSAEEAAEVTRRLVETFPDLDLPTPVELERQTLEVAPVAELTLLREAAMPAARLDYRYDREEVGSGDIGPRVQRLHGNTLVTVMRDREAEQDLAGTLLGLGMEMHGYREPRWSFPGDKPTALNRWAVFLEEDLPRLEQAGWEVFYDPTFDLEFLQAGSIHLDLEEQEGGDWFGARLGIDVEGERIDLAPLLADLVERLPGPQALAEREEPFLIPLGDGRYLSLPPERLRPLLGTLHELFDRPERKPELSRAQALRLTELDESDYVIGGAAELRRQLEKLRGGKPARAVRPPRALRAELRDYQHTGLEWLSLMRETGCHGILADDMGLGKTLQTLAHLLREKQARRLNRPSLLVAPTSVISNWRREAERFTPTLKVLVLHGLDRREYFGDIDHHDLVITTYPLLPRDREELREHSFYYLILDEAQVVKNPKAKAARVVRELDAEHRLCLTGTPMENHLGELWTQFDFLMPGLLGDSRQFRRLFRTPIEEHGDSEARQRLARRVRPFILRRSKDDVMAELPEKTHIERVLTLSPAQTDLYETVRVAMEKKVRDALAKKGLARSQITLLDALLKLRQVCCDPRLLPGGAGRTAASVKLQYLRELLPELVEEGRRILLFSQFTSMLSLIADELDQLGIPWLRLTGQTRKRDAVIDRFRAGEAPVFLISLKAGGVGLNLTEADTVIHYDPWWNPAVESQATDRAHRIGQDKKVFVYKLLTENTVEERIQAMQARKQALAASVHGADAGEAGFTEDDVNELLRPLTP